MPDEEKEPPSSTSGCPETSPPQEGDSCGEDSTPANWNEANPPIEQIDRARRTLHTSAPLSGFAAPDSVDTTPEQIGRFKVVRELGRGGGGVVFQAHDPKLDRDIAVKVPSAETLLTSDLRKRFELEAHAAAMLSHPGIVPVFEVSTGSSFSFIASEYCDAENLASWQKRRTDVLSEDFVVTLICHVAEAVAHAHARGVVHRDLKPSNILMVHEAAAASEDRPSFRATATIQGRSPAASPAEKKEVWRPRITDFGLAQLTAADASRSNSEGFIGTPSYVAPELIEGESRKPDPRTDVYGLGAVLYQLLTRRPPFREATAIATLVAVRQEAVQDPTALRWGLSPDLAAIVLKCLEKRPEDRYESVAALIADLERFRNQEPTLARPLGAYRRALRWAKRNQAATSLFAIVLLSALSLTFGAVWHAERLADELERNEQLRKIAEAGESALRRRGYLADMRLAGQLFNDGRLEDALRRLENYQLPLPFAEERDFVWHYLRERYDRQVQVFAGHEGDVSCFVVSPDRGVLITGGHDGTVRAFRMEDQQQLAVIRPVESNVNALAITPDEGTLVVGADGGVLMIVDLRPLDEGRTLEVGPLLVGHGDDVLCAAISADGKRLATAGFGGRILCWNLPERRIERSLEFHPKWVRTLRFIPGETYRVASIAHHGKVVWWDTETGEQLAANDVVDGMGLSMAIDPTHAIAALGGSRGVLRFVQLGPELLPATAGSQAEKASDEGSSDEMVSSTNFDGWVRAVDFSDDGEFLVAGGNDPVIRIFRRERDGSYQLWSKILGHGSRTWKVAFLPGTRTIVSAGEDGTAKVTSALPAADAELSQQQLRLSRQARPISLTSDRNRGVIIDGQTGVQLSLESPIPDRDNVFSERETHELRRVAVSPDGRYLAAISEHRKQGRLMLFDALTSEQLALVEDHFPEGHAIAFHPGGDLLVTGGIDGSVDVRRIPGLAAEPGYVLPDLADHSDVNVPDLLYSNDGSLLAACMSHGPNLLLVWQDSSSLEHPITVEGVARLLDISADGQRLAIVGMDHKIHVWDVATQESLQTLEGHDDRALSGSFSSDGRYLATSAETGPIKIWTLDYGELAVDIDEGLAVPCVRFLADDRLLITHVLERPDGSQSTETVIRPRRPFSRP